MQEDPNARRLAAVEVAVEPRSWLRRMLWFIGLWLASVAVLGAVALLIRFWISP